MGHGPGANLPGYPVSSYWNQHMTPSNLLGISAGAGTKAAGAALPPTTAGAGDMVSQFWHPDSPVFWLLVLAGTTVAGMTGASVKVRAFKGRAGANVGDA